MYIHREHHVEKMGFSETFEMIQKKARTVAFNWLFITRHISVQYRHHKHRTIEKSKTQQVQEKMQEH